jgi:hypothetical protein
MHRHSNALCIRHVFDHHNAVATNVRPRQVWQFDTGAPVFSSPCAVASPADPITQPRIVVGSHDHCVYCLDAAGCLLWSSECVGWMFTSHSAPTLWFGFPLKTIRRCLRGSSGHHLGPRFSKSRAELQSETQRSHHILRRRCMRRHRRHCIPLEVCHYAVFNQTNYVTICRLVSLDTGEHAVPPLQLPGHVFSSPVPTALPRALRFSTR